MKKFKDSELAYIAGLFDLGGCIRIEKSLKSKTLPSLYVWITSKHFRLMEHLQKFGAVIGQKSDGQYRAKWKDNSAYSLLRSIYNLLLIRKEQAKIGMEFMEAKKQNPDFKDSVVYQLRLRLVKKETD